MTKQEYEKALENIPDFAYIFVRVKERTNWWEFWKHIGSYLTQYGTGNFCHVEVKMPDLFNQKNIVICANGKKVVLEKVKKYLSDYKKYELHIKMLKNLQESDKKYMLDEAQRQLNGNIEYDWKGIRGMTYKALLTKIPVVGFFINMFIWNLPSIHDENKLFCVESSAKIGNAIPNKNGGSKYNLKETCPPTILYEQEGVWDEHVIIISA
ncbi:MAG: hypothetical protein NC918_02680 [Candidatus Omnitrophica bacterium]|nr:hypothetical protein [Candidatus Omnitrophota bacterium]